MRGDGVALDVLPVRRHVDLFVQCLEIESQGHIGRFVRLHADGLRCRFEALEFRDDRTIADRRPSKPEMPLLVRDLHERLRSGAHQRQRDARHTDSLAIGSGKRHGAGDGAGSGVLLISTQIDDP